MKKLVFASVIALASLSLVPAHTLRAQDQKSISIQDPAEYNAYQMANSQSDPKAKAAALEDFLTKYPKRGQKRRSRYAPGYLPAAASGLRQDHQCGNPYCFRPIPTISRQSTFRFSSRKPSAPRLRTRRPATTLRLLLRRVSGPPNLPAFPTTMEAADRSNRDVLPFGDRCRRPGGKEGSRGSR